MTMWLSDRLPAQCRHAEEHQFCLAHLIRDAQHAIDHGDTSFAPAFKVLLKDACAVGRRRPDLADATIAAHRRRLERQLERLLARKPTDAEGRKLKDAVYLDCRDKLFVFLKRRDAEPTNNESERALRPSVIFRKVTNGFRSEWGATTPFMTNVYDDFGRVKTQADALGNVWYYFFAGGTRSMEINPEGGAHVLYYEKEIRSWTSRSSSGRTWPTTESAISRRPPTRRVTPSS